MPTSYTTNLGLALPVQGELAGTWGDVVNNEITSLLDSAIAGTTTLSSDADATLTDTDGAANQSRQAILLWTANGTATRTITAPARTKAYVVINATAGTQSIKLVGAGPTTGITVVAGEKCLAAWDGSDFVKVASSVVDGVSTISFGTTGLTPSTATAGAVTVAGTLAVANGGTGQTTVQAAINALAGAVTSGHYLRGNGTNVVMSAIQAADVPTLNQNTTGTASNVTGTVATANGGTGLTSFTANGVVYASSTSVLATSSALTFDGSKFASPVLSASNGIYVNKNTVSTSTSVSSGDNAMSAGPMSVNTGITVTIPSGSVWTIV